MSRHVGRRGKAVKSRSEVYETLPGRCSGFLDWVYALADERGVSIQVMNSNSISADGIPCSGYFDPGSRSLRVAAGSAVPRERWLSVLIHEAAHLVQWTRKTRSWTACRLNGRDVTAVVDGYLQRPSARFAKSTIDEAFRRVVAMELEAERMAARMIVRHNLPIDLDTYVRKANAYLTFYRWSRQNRLWYSRGRPPYKFRAIWSKMPADFRTLNYRSLGLTSRLPSFDRCRA